VVTARIRRDRRPTVSARARAALVLALLGPLGLGSLCEGSGTEQPGIITQAPIDPRCTPIGGPFPAGFDLLPESPGVAVAMRFLPAGLLRFDVSIAPPRPDNPGPVPSLPADSDGDGEADVLAYRAAGLCPASNPSCLTSPVVGTADAVAGELTLVTASGYEEVLFYAPETGDLTALEVANPADAGAHRAADRPLAPPGGTAALRTALSTLVCAYPESPVDSTGRPIAASPHCDPARVGFLTRFTAATAMTYDRLYVATSNLASSARAAFHPGTVLVHVVERGPDGRPIRIRPDTDTPVLFTTAFNPTGLTAHRTAGGRDVVLVSQTGAIDAAGTLFGDAALDVIDAAAARVVATIPLGRAGAVAGPVAIDPGGHVALVGAESSRSLYAVDLAALDDPALYSSPRPHPVVLDGSTPGFADARVFDADAPLALPRRPDGPPDVLCTTRTNVALSHDARLAYTTDWCDGSIAVVAIDWTLPLERPLSPTRFGVVRRIDVVAPRTPASFGLPAAPSRPRTRPGVPGVDFDGPDLLFLLNEPEGQLCAVRIEP
jgi:hypothetical protein